MDHTIPAEARYGDENRALLERDERVFFRQAGSTPCLAAIRRAEGIWLEDALGHRVIDLHGNNAHHVGYGHPRLVEAIVRQIEALPFTPRRFTDEPAIELAERLCRGWPGGDGKVLFATGGSDAVEIAVKLARVATGRYKTLSFYDSYHGSGFGALSLGGRPLDRSPRLGPLLPGALHVPPYYGLPGEAGGLRSDAEKWAERCLDSIRAVFAQEDGIAAVIAEPVRSTPYVPSAWFWPEVRALCDEHGTLLIFDEIPTGLGKTGRLFASEHFGVRPDATVLGKALGGGLLPIAAVIADRALDTAQDLSLGHYTHEKNPVTATAALTTLDIIEDGDLAGHAQRVGEVALERLREVASRCRLVREVRGKGLLLALDLHEDRQSGRSGGQVAESITLGLFERGVNVSCSADGVISLSAPLVITELEMLGALEALDETLREEAAQ